MIPGKARGLWATFAVVAALLVWMVVIWIHFGRTVIGSYSPLPFYDYWDTVPKIDAYRRLNFRVLWQQHSEHRIVFPEIIFAADYIFFQGREILPIALNVLFYFSTWLLFAVTLYRNRQLPRVGPSLRYYCRRHRDGLGRGRFLDCRSISRAVVPAISGGCYGALSVDASCPVRGDPGCILPAQSRVPPFVLTPRQTGYSFGLVILLAGWILRLTKSQFLILAASGAASIGLYFIGYHFSLGLTSVHCSLILFMHFHSWAHISGCLSP